MESYMNLGHEKASIQHLPDNVMWWSRNGNTFYIHCHQCILELAVKSDRILRFRYAPYGLFERDFSYSTAYQFLEEETWLDLKEDEAQFILQTSLLQCVILKENLKVTILDRNGKILCEDEKGFHWEDNISKGGEVVLMSKKIQSGEFFFGLGDKAADSNLRGKRFQMWGKDNYAFGKNSDPLYKNIPFFLGLHHKTAYGIFFDNSFESFFDFGYERKNVYSFWANGGEMNYYFIYGPQLLKVVETYHQLTGVPELPPLWSLGYQQCKWSYFPETKVRDICQEFRTRKLPCDAIYLDIDYMDGFRCFTWNPDHFPNPTRFIADLEKDGFKTVVIIDPGIKIDKDYWVYQEALAKGYFCKRQDGALMKGAVWPGLCNFPDFTNPSVRDWWAGLFKELITENGVRGVWNDMNEPAVFEIETFPEDVRHDYDGDSCSHRKAHNVYGSMMAKATYDGMKLNAPSRRPLVITRSAYAGVQRYSSVWTGDNIASWEHLWLANIMVQRLNISGISFSGTDIGGFIETPTPELFVRWIQLGIFHPFCRNHSSGDHGDQEPWAFGEETTDIFRKYVELRYQLLPYLYTTFWQHVTKGTPMIRPLAFLDQMDTETYYRQDEFGLGNHLLICPIVQPEAEGRWLYLPSGCWYCYWTNEKFYGGMETWADAPLDTIPLYVKAGAVLPHYPVMQYVGEFEITQLTLHVYYHYDQESSALYEDEGDGYGYKNGSCNVKNFLTFGDDLQFEIHQENIGKYATSYNSYFIIVYGLPYLPKEVCNDNEMLGFEYDKSSNQLSFQTDINFKRLLII